MAITMTLRQTYPDEGILDTGSPPLDIGNLSRKAEARILLSHINVSGLEALMHAFVVRARLPSRLGCHAIIIPQFSFISYEGPRHIKGYTLQL